MLSKVVLTKEVQYNPGRGRRIQLAEEGTCDMTDVREWRGEIKMTNAGHTTLEQQEHHATRVCVLRSGGDFGPQHVQWLAKQIPGLVCLADVPVEGVPTIALPDQWPGWWAKMHLFDPDLIEGDILFFDLDTVVVGSLEGFDTGFTTMLSDFFNPELACSSLMYIASADKEAVWNAWKKSPDKHMDRCRTRECWGDQGFLGSVLSPQRWQDVLPGRIVSYKLDCMRGLPDEADVVCFHGEPRPWASGESWVPAFDGASHSEGQRYKPRRRKTLMERVKRLFR